MGRMSKLECHSAISPIVVEDQGIECGRGEQVRIAIAFRFSRRGHLRFKAGAMLVDIVYTHR